MSSLDKDRITEGVGGQAVIEGIMLRNKTHYVVAVRKPAGNIDFIKEQLAENKNPFSKIFFLRGIVNFLGMMKLGYKTLVFSANTAMPEGEKKEEITPLAMTLTMMLSLALAVALFIATPYLVTNLIGIDERTQTILFNVTRGGVKLFIFTLYLFVISFFKDVKRVFEYHGAEHMVVNAYEHGESPSKENIINYTTIHPRCGTTFMFLVLSISIILYVFTSYFVYSVIFASAAPAKIIGNLTVLAINILLLPIVSGISYEILRLGFRFYNFPLMRLVILPGLLLQKITTKKPKEDELEVALLALDKLLDKNVGERTIEETESSVPA